MSKPTAIVVGSGVGGTAAAARLAMAGFEVTVLEKNDYTGGRCSILRDAEGHRFDQGPSLLLLPRLFHQTFRDLGTTMEDEDVLIRKCEPNYHVHFGDKESMLLSTDSAVMKTEVERFEGKDGYEGYLGFMREAHQHYELSVEHVLGKNFTSYASMLRPSFIRRVFTLHPFTSIYSRASHYFKTDRLRRVFTFASMYMGMSPYDAPGTYSLLQYTELAEGIWYPLGGFHTVIAALVKIAERNGATFRLSTPVSKVLVDPKDAKRAIGVKLETGEELHADVVVVNADLIWSMENLFEKTSYSKRLANKPVSCSSISFYWSIDRVVPEIGIHNIFLADEYKESFDSIFNKHAMPDEPSFYLNCPSRIDPSAAPAGTDTIVVLVPVGHISSSLPSSSDWSTLVDQARQHVYKTLEIRLGLKDFPKWVKHEIVNDPISWEERFNLHRGSILGLSHSFFNVLSFRPATRHPKINNSYFVGASAHPGTGVPICLAGARLTVDQILSDRKMANPWVAREQALAAAEEKAQTKVLDRVNTSSVELTMWISFFAAFIALMVGMVPVIAGYAVSIE